MIFCIELQAKIRVTSALCVEEEHAVMCVVHMELRTAPYQCGMVLSAPPWAFSLRIYGRLERLNISHTFIKCIRQTVEHQHV